MGLDGPKPIFSKKDFEQRVFEVFDFFRLCEKKKPNKEEIEQGVQNLSAVANFIDLNMSEIGPIAGS